MFERIRNLWRVSEFTPDEDTKLRRTIFPKQEQKLATIVDAEPKINMFPDPDENETTQ